MNTTQKSLASIVGAAAVAALYVLVPKYEGTKFDPYIDPVGIKTVCTGSITNVEDRTYTPEECSERLDGELAEHAEGAMNCLTKPTTPGQRVAYVSLAFNIGVTAFCRSTLMRLHNAGAGVVACAELSKWDKGMVGGKLVALPGLTRRRAEEREYCEGRKQL
jgi:lysozyme